jgi:hypothetical protein
MLSFIAPGHIPPASAGGRSTGPLPDTAGTWTTACLDCTKIFYPMSDRSLALDAGGHPHIAFGGNRLYYTHNPGEGWQTELVDASPQVGVYASLALDAAGQPHIAYFDEADLDLMYAVRDGAGWHIEVIDDVGRFSEYASLALDGESYPRITYNDETGDLLKYAYQDAAGWHVETVDTGYAGDYSSLALDAEGRPHISYVGHGDLRYAYRDAAGWHIEMVHEYADHHTSLALDEEGYPRISYWENHHAHANLWYAYRDQAGWHTEMVDYLVTGEYTGLSLAVDDAGKPHVSYADTDWKVQYAYRDDGGWHMEALDPHCGSAVATSLSLDSDGDPRVSYGGGPLYNLQYAYKDAAGWHAETVEHGGPRGHDSSLALDEQGYPHVSHKAEYDYDLLYTYLDASGSHTEVVDSEGAVGAYTSLALDTAGNPHVSYYDASNGDLKYAHRSPSGWAIETADSAGDVGSHTSLSLDGGGNPHISYYDVSSGDLRYTYRDAGGWHPEVVDSAGTVGQYTSMALDAAGDPHIGYYDETNEDLKYAHRDGGGWHIETVNSLAAGKYCSLALDSGGYPHLSYSRTSSGLNYAFRDAAGWHSVRVDNATNAVVWTSLALDESGFPHISYYDFGNYDLKYAYLDAAGWHVELVDGTGTVGRYNSLALDGHGNPHISYEDGTLGDLKYAFRSTPIQLTGLEVTQGIQNLMVDAEWEWNAPVELIEGKRTFVRAHVQGIDGPVADVTARLIGKRNGSPLPGSPLTPGNTGGSVDVLGQNPPPNRSELNDSFYFELPYSWRSGTVELEVQGVSDIITCSEGAGTPGDCKVAVSFVETPRLEARIIGFTWFDSEQQHRPSGEDLRSVAAYIEASYPIERLDWDSPIRIERQVEGPYDYFLAEVNIRLWEQRLADGCFGFNQPAHCRRIYTGVVVDQPVGVASGMGFATTVAGYWRPNYPWVLPHELGHALLGPGHTLCSGKEPGALDPDYPYSYGWISQDTQGDAAFYGFDFNHLHGDRPTYAPSSGDLMSYCDTVWPSKYTYERIRSIIADRFGLAAGDVPADAAGSGAVLALTGVITPALGLGRIASAYVFDSGSAPPSPEPGTYEIQLLAAAGQLLVAYPFEPEFQVPDVCTDCSSESEMFAIFGLALPWSPAAARIDLVHAGVALDSASDSSHEPEVTVLSPNGGEYLDGPSATLAWSASDGDSDLLECAIQFSPDGGATWTTLVSGWSGTEYVLPLTYVEGTEQGLIRVLATDGFNTSQDQSDATFSVARHAPAATLLAPVDGSLYVGDQLLILDGRAIDNEDGDLPDAALTWTSDLDGVLGTGRSLDVAAATLTEGTHTITLAAQDADGQIGTDTISVEVYRDRPVLPPSLAVAPDALSFLAYEGSGQTAAQVLSVRNDGDGALSWTAEADQPWIVLGSAQGTAPADIEVVADATGLVVGNYTGSAVVSAPGATGSPQTISITLRVTAQGRRVHLPLVMLAH